MAKIDTILVVGGGLAGLTKAAALRQHGFTVELVERRETWHARRGRLSATLLARR